MSLCGPVQTDENGLLRFISVENRDARGTHDYNTELQLSAEAEGDVEFLVCGNGDPRSLHVPSDPVFKTYQGRAQIIIMKKHPDAAVTLKVSNAEDGSILQSISI